MRIAEDGATMKSQHPEAKPNILTLILYELEELYKLNQPSPNFFLSLCNFLTTLRNIPAYEQQSRLRQGQIQELFKSLFKSCSMPNGADVKDRRERFMRLYGPLRPRLARFASAMANDREEARDLVAETTLVAYEQFESLKNEKAFLSWLFTIASRLYKKRMLRERWYGNYDEEQARRMPDLGTSPETSADVALLYSALSQLPEEQREAVILFEISDLSLKEISTIQGVSLSGIKSRVTRGRQRLSELLRSGEPQEELLRQQTTPPAEQSASGNKKILYMNAA